MPNGDRTGPDGNGPRTGRKLGFCSGNNQPGRESNEIRQGQGRNLRNGSGRGKGEGRGLERGRGCRKVYQE